MTRRNGAGERDLVTTPRDVRISFTSFGSIMTPPLATLEAIMHICMGDTVTVDWPMPAHTRSDMLPDLVGKEELYNVRSSN